MKIAAFVTLALLLVYIAVELGWGGGDRNHPDHYRPPWPLA